jgi:hypothetical protein
MSAAKLASLGGLLAAALIATVWLQHDDGATPGQRPAEQTNVARDAVAAVESIAPAAAPTAAAAARPSEPTGMRRSEAELRAQATQASYARVGSALVDYLVERGLARVDGEPVVRRFLEDSTSCLFDALRVEAGAQSVAYDSVLDALEAELYDTDGPLLGALLDMRAVVNRIAPCAQTAAQQAGIEPAALPETTRAAIIRALR